MVEELQLNTYLRPSPREFALPKAPTLQSPSPLMMSVFSAGVTLRVALKRVFLLLSEAPTLVYLAVFPEELPPLPLFEDSSVGT